jgi:hypothetical protein
MQKRGWFTSKRGNRCSALGRKKVSVDVAQIAALREQGLSWRTIASQLGVGEGTVRRAALSSAKNVSEMGTGTALVSGAASAERNTPQTHVYGAAQALTLFCPRCHAFSNGEEYYHGKLHDVRW